jgi:hypothetical protein
MSRDHYKGVPKNRVLIADKDNRARPLNKINAEPSEGIGFSEIELEPRSSFPTTVSGTARIFVDVSTGSLMYGDSNGSTPEELVGGGSGGSTGLSGLTRWTGLYDSIDSDDSEFLYIDGAQGSGTSTQIGCIAPGSIVGLHFIADQAITAGTITLNVFKQTGGTGPSTVFGSGVLKVVLSSAGQKVYSTFARGAYTYAAGDILRLQWVADGDLLPDTVVEICGAIFMAND